MPISHLREQISFVGHDAGIFPTSILDNLCMGASYSQSGLKRYARTQILLTSLKGYRMGIQPYWERGVCYYLKVKDSLALARAILRDTPIVLLDEATMHLMQLPKRQLGMRFQRYLKIKPYWLSRIDYQQW